MVISSDFVSSCHSELAWTILLKIALGTWANIDLSLHSRIGQKSKWFV